MSRKEAVSNRLAERILEENNKLQDALIEANMLPDRAWMQLWQEEDNENDMEME
jgi:hypothetical protein